MRIKLLLLLQLLFVVVCGCTLVEANPSLRGEREARRDIAKGDLRHKVYGCPTEWAPEYWDVLEDDYGIKTDGAFMDHRDYSESYNRLMTPEIMRIHGSDVFARAKRKGLAIYEARNKALESYSSAYPEQPRRIDEPRNAPEIAD